LGRLQLDQRVDAFLLGGSLGHDGIPLDIVPHAAGRG
jgi:hypothetical protein